MNYFLFIVYLVALCWLVQQVPFFKKTGLGSRMILLLFVIKVIAGITIGWLSLHYYSAANDYWDINREGLKEYHLLISEPKEYFSNFFRTDYPQGYAGLFDSFHSFWNDLRNNLVIKLVSVFDIFSRGDYYINSLFFNFLVFFGHAALYRIFIYVYPKLSFPVVLGCFIWPSMVYFTSGIHRDGIVFLSLALIVYTLFFSLVQKKVKPGRWVMIVFFSVILFLARNFLFIALVPSGIAWVISEKLKWKPLPVFCGVYLFMALLFFNINRVVPSLNPLETIVQKQSDFNLLPPSATDLQMDTLQPVFSSFLKNLPGAYNHLLLRPYLTEIPSLILLPMNVELFLIQFFFVLFLFFRRRGMSHSHGPFIFFCLFFVFTTFLFIGYIVPNIGTLVRYRSLYLPFIVTPLFCSVDWEKLGRLIKIIK